MVVLDKIVESGIPDASVTEMITLVTTNRRAVGAVSLAGIALNPLNLVRTIKGNENGITPGHAGFAAGGNPGSSRIFCVISEGDVNIDVSRRAADRGAIHIVGRIVDITKGATGHGHVKADRSTIILKHAALGWAAGDNVSGAGLRASLGLTVRSTAGSDRIGKVHFNNTANSKSRQWTKATGGVTGIRHTALLKVDVIEKNLRVISASKNKVDVTHKTRQRNRSNGLAGSIIEFDDNLYTVEAFFGVYLKRSIEVTLGRSHDGVELVATLSVDLRESKVFDLLGALPGKGVIVVRDDAAEIV
mmetsp:Transcript_20475/g.40263  ORF Transcript_20475/g.40263 Transcript_20475/m.40263 type:complete len:303 (+) Transcript_20475:1861-2769(+)